MSSTNSACYFTCYSERIYDEKYSSLFAFASSAGSQVDK